MRKPEFIDKDKLRLLLPSQAEFGITPVDLMYMGTQGENGENTHCTAVFLCTTFSGTPKADGKEMHGAFFLSPEKLDEQFGDHLFPPFADSLKMSKSAQIMQTLSMDISDGCGIMKEDQDGPGAPIGNDNAAKDHVKQSETTSYLRPLKEGLKYTDYDFSDEMIEFESMYSAEEREKARRNSERRSKHREGWAHEDLDEAIHGLLKSPKSSPPTPTGKIEFSSDETPITICHDLHSDYFTVIDKSAKGEDRYRDIHGKSVLNKTVKRGSRTVTVGRPKDERRRITHFNRRRNT